MSAAASPNDAPWLQGESAHDAPPPLELFDDGPPLEDFDDDGTAPVKAAKGIPALQGHPNYALLNKLFSHRVREAGALEAKAAEGPPPASDADATPSGTAAEEAEA